MTTLSTNCLGYKYIMLNEFSWVMNTLLLLLGSGAFLINQIILLRFAALLACSLLFFSFSFNLVGSTVISNLSLILINTFYLFKLYLPTPTNNTKFNNNAKV